MHWINVNDKLPEIPTNKHSITVLIAKFDVVYNEMHPNKGYSVSTMIFDKDGNFKDLAWDVRTGDTTWIVPCGPITHWMYLPDPPDIQEACNFLSDLSKEKGQERL
uniref:DUF551 domain-containing protein n=1 Tax=viral metagenome TaxID=1070528 RepID=A0A6H1Z9R5_9ZZZZ